MPGDIMSVSVQDILPPTVSCSRTGRMADSFGSVHFSKQARQQKFQLDMSKLLSVDEVRQGEEDAAAKPAGGELCSSARVHPSVLQKASYVTTVEKEVAFRKLKDSLEPEEPEVDLCAVQLDAAIAAQERNIQWAKSGRKGKGKKARFPSSSFSAPGRLDRSEKRAPPVGHYHPRFNIVEQQAHNVLIAKSTHHHSPRKRSPSSIAPAAVPNATLSSLQLDATTVTPGSPAPQKKPQAAATPEPVHVGTWPFASNVAGHDILRLLPPSISSNVDLSSAYVNRRLVDKASTGAFSMAKTVGRDQISGVRSASPDLFYNAEKPPPHVPTFSIGKHVARDKAEKLPRTAHDLVTDQVRLKDTPLDKVKFQKQPVLVHFKPSSSPLRNSMLVTTTTISDIKGERPSERTAPKELPVPTQRHLPNFYMKKTVGRKDERPPIANDVVYEVEYSQLDKHWPTTKITGTPVRPMPGQLLCETKQIDVGKYRVDSELVHKKLAHNISFSASVSREAREKVGRAAVVTPELSATEVYDVKRNETRVKGDPMIALHMSREKRMCIMSPDPTMSDKVYDVDPNYKYPRLQRGAVGFDQMVTREKHLGTHFANVTRNVFGGLSK